MISHKLIRLLEQPSIPKEILFRIRHGHSHCCIEARKLIGNHPKMLIDVGANSGDFIEAMRFNFPSVKVYAFEPLKEHYEKLKSIKNVEVYQVGLWNENTIKTFNVNKEENAESSFLTPKNYSSEKRKVELKRFDNLNIKIERPCFLKIDVEGAEDRVLEGFGEKLKEIDAVQVELLFSSLFKKQVLLSKISKILEKAGFIGFKQMNITYEKNGKPQKCDLIFFR